MSDRSFIYSAYPETFNLPANTTLTINPIPGQIAGVLKHISGGSLVIAGGTTVLGTSYVIGNYYPMSTNETMNLDLSGTLILYATGSTCVFTLLRGRSAGF